MKLLNLGCGYQFHDAWVNIDFVSPKKGVLSHNLLEGIPFSENEFDVIYHSHLLEHFSKSDGKKFIKECYRVLKPGGIIRIAVPNLEVIVVNYLKNLEGALNGDQDSTHNYEWIMLEMYDQSVRNQSGGEMAKYLSRDEVPNMSYVIDRIGEEGKRINEGYLYSKIPKKILPEVTQWLRLKSLLFQYLRNIKLFLFHLVFRENFEVLAKNSDALKIGKFRLSGEVHLWMYDRYSLTTLLKNCGFKNIKVVSGFESRVPDWNEYKLDSDNGILRKPDSLFIEALK